MSMHYHVKHRCIKLLRYVMIVLYLSIINLKECTTLFKTLVVLNILK